MKVFVGLGGTGIRTVRDYASRSKNHSHEMFYYVDTGQEKERSNEMYMVPAASSGSGTLRSIGRNATLFDLYVGKLAQYFSEINEPDEIELIFVLSSSGGFGGAALFPLLDYLEAIAWKKLKSCVVIAYNEGIFSNLGFPQHMLRRFEANTIEFVSELALREQSYAVTNQFADGFLCPSCNSFLIDTQNVHQEDYWQYLDTSRDLLRSLDCKDRYQLSVSKEKKTVFISYSSKDQKIADMVVDALQNLGITSWIATRDLKSGSYAKQIVGAIRGADVFLVLISKNSIQSEQVKNEIDLAFGRIKEGMKLIPFMLDNSDLDDECKYYLCRQEMIFGATPPLEGRINELVQRIHEVLI